jgi:protein-S-isoprenylcysteine O-methyltransferase Ste14
MDLMLFALQVIFMAPMLLRVARRTRPETTIVHELAASLRTPGLLVHEIGLLLVWIGFAVKFWTVGIDRAPTWPGAIGSTLLVIATWLMFSSFAALRSWRLLPTIAAGHQLCAQGPYRLTRHPIYLAFDLLGIGLAVAVPTLVVCAGAALLIVGGELRARAEERALVAAFGERYQEYARQVARRIPGVY